MGYLDVNEDKGDGDVLNNSLKPEVDRWSFIDDEEDERQGSLLLIKRGGCLPFKYSNFQQIYKKNSTNFIKNSGLIRSAQTQPYPRAKSQNDI